MTVGVLGAGQIGSAIAKIVSESGRYRVVASRRNILKIRDLEALGVELTQDNKELASRSDIVIVSVKPHKVVDVLREVSEYLDGKIVISVAAAIPIRSLVEAAPRAKIVRAMPNIAILVKGSFTAYSIGPGLGEEDVRKVEELFKLMGECIEVDEELMDAITALSGSGPAYVSTLIEAMAYAGLKVGLPRELAYYSAAYTVYGSAKLYLETRLHPSIIKEMVLTPAGVTVEGIFYLEEGGIRTAVMKAVEAATKRAREIAERLNKK
ncbi:MAG: pyrroline-5-carboxylate reductase [Aigarchaeota archaeon]|nr:pyrroline-5-carboxylate reductase [Aigarchaeota archaeon]MCX8193327.1 pyrroline-5-carboxylate reductase [Nitrososphaeria archaeon]